MADQDFLTYVQARGAVARPTDQPAATQEEWIIQRAELRERLIASWGGFPSEHCDLDPQSLGIIARVGYRVEKLLLQTRPGIRMTANLYVPDAEGPFPAVLCVHGHWRLAKSQPEIQSRCISLAKLGFVVLMVDALGAGERGIGKDLGEYHGEMVAGTLWPTGLALAGLQVYENMRAVDYLQSRPEVIIDRIGVTGASGGGNQSMNVGAIDERLKCVVPVCSVGTFQAYLGAACCMCEVTPGAMSFTEEGAVLALVAPRALMLINATQDSHQFSVGEGAKSLEYARQIFALYGVGKNARQAVFESGHGYNQEMRSAMYGWMMLHLKDSGDGSPIAEPEHVVEEPEVLRCFPGQSRPDDFITLPQFAGREARSLVSRHGVPTHREQWQTQEMTRVAGLRQLLGPFPLKSELKLETSAEKNDVTNGGRLLTFSSEPGLRLSAIQRGGNQSQRVILLSLDEGRNVINSELAKAWLRQGRTVISMDLRATGELAWKSDSIGRAPDHNTAEWSLWIGRPLLAQWVWDVERLLDSLDQLGAVPERTTLVGMGPAGLVAICAAALSTRIDQVGTTGALGSYVTDQPYEGQRLGTLVPGILRDVGDIPHIAATISPRKLVVSQPTDGQNKVLDQSVAEDLWRPVTAAYALEGAGDQFVLTQNANLDALL